MECIRGLYVWLLLELYLGLIVLFFDFFIRSIRLGIQPVEIVIVRPLCELVAVLRFLVQREHPAGEALLVFKAHLVGAIIEVGRATLRPTTGDAAASVAPLGLPLLLSAFEGLQPLVEGVRIYLP